MAWPIVAFPRRPLPRLLRAPNRHARRAPTSHTLDSRVSTRQTRPCGFVANPAQPRLASPSPARNPLCGPFGPSFRPSSGLLPARPGNILTRPALRLGHEPLPLVRPTSNSQAASAVIDRHAKGCVFPSAFLPPPAGRMARASHPPLPLSFLFGSGIASRARAGRRRAACSLCPASRKLVVTCSC